MENKNRNLFLRLFFCAAAGIVLLALSVFAGHFLLGNFVVYRNLLSGILCAVFTGLLFCVLWIFSYICLDAVKREPLKNILLVFVFSSAAQFLFSSVLGFIAENPWVSPGGFYSGLFNLVTGTLPSLLALVCVFKAIVFNFEAFDETVDALVYGGIAGVGMAFCDTLSVIFSYSSASFDFVLLNFAVRLSLFSCASAFSGCLMFYSARRKNSFLRTIALYAGIAAVFGFCAFVERTFSHGIFTAPYARGFSLLWRTSVFCAAVYAFTVALIFFQLEKPFTAFKNKTGAAEAAVFILAFALAVFVRTAPDKNTEFTLTADSKNYSFELPVGFEEYKEKKLFSFSEKKQDTFCFVNRAGISAKVIMDFDVFCDSELQERPEWTLLNQKTESAQNEYVYEYEVCGFGKCIKIKTVLAEEDDGFAFKIYRTFIKKLEAE